MGISEPLFTPTASWFPLLWAAVFLVAIWWLSRQLAGYVMAAIYHLTQSQSLAVTLYAILFLPGTLVHESSHWAMARLLGVKTAGFRILPRVDAKGQVQLGAVDVRGGGLVEHTLIGMAPMLVGGLLTVALSYILVDVNAVRAALQADAWSTLIQVLTATFHRPDAWILFYLLFTISSSMFLSASDRAPMQQMALYVALVLLLLYLLGVNPALPPSWTQAVSNVAGVFAAGLAVTLVLHLVMTLLAWLFYLLIASYK